MRTNTNVLANKKATRLLRYICKLPIDYIDFGACHIYNSHTIMCVEGYKLFMQNMLMILKKDTQTELVLLQLCARCHLRQIHLLHYNSIILNGLH